MSVRALVNDNDTFENTHVCNYENALSNAISSITKNINKVGDRNPKIGNQHSKYDFCGPSDWVSGFWPGQLWLAYKVSAQSELKNSASLRIAYNKNLLNHPDWLDHDLGFQFSLTAVAEYKLTGNVVARDQAIKAADALLSRFRRIGKYIVAWNETHELGLTKTQGRTIIDSLQNLSLLFWASNETSNPTYRDAAIAHADTLMKYIVRDDYSTFHTYNFDPLTQEPIAGETFQGYSDDSCWTRGQGWAVHGYAQIFEHTGDEKYLQLAKNLADYAIKRLPDDGVVLWDFDLPAHEIQYRDSSASALLAAGMLLISTHCNTSREEDIYYKESKRILKGLITQCDLTKNPHAEGLLSEGASFVNGGLTNNMLPYGDYYYLEALMRINGYTEFFWK